MNGRAGIPLLLAAAALMVLGIAWGAATQHETFLGQQESEQLEAAGSLVILSSFLCGIAVLVAFMALGDASPWRRMGGSLQAGLAAWILVALVQSDFPNYNVLEATQTATIGQNTLLVDAGGSPSVFIPVLALGLVCLWAIMDGFRRAHAPVPNPRSLAQTVRAHAAAVALAVPFLVIVVVGAVQVMLSIPGTTPRVGLAFALLPLASAAALGLAIVLVVRVWHGAGVLQDPRIAPFTREVWRALSRVEIALASVLAATAVLSTALPVLETDATAAGRTLVLTLRSHGQGLLFALLPLVPLVALNRRLMAGLDNVEPDEAAKSHAIALTIAASASLGLVVLGALTQWALLPWILALLPMAILGGLRFVPHRALPIMFLAAWVFWARGNTIVADYNGMAYPTLDFATHPGLLALWRLAGAALAAWALHRVARVWGARERVALAVPLALAVAIGAVLLGILEAPLWAWDESRVPVNKLAVGSLLRSQTVAVQWVAHVLSLVGAVGAALAIGRLRRPDWFVRLGAP